MLTTSSSSMPNLKQTASQSQRHALPAPEPAGPVAAQQPCLHARRAHAPMPPRALPPGNLLSGAVPPGLAAGVLPELEADRLELLLCCNQFDWSR